MEYCNAFAYETELDAMREKIAFLEEENKKLKTHVQKLAIENSDLVMKKKTNPLVKQKWQHYRDYKEEIKKKNQNLHWREIKKISDEMLANKK